MTKNNMADGSKLSVDKLRSAIADILETEELDSLTSRIVRNSLEKRFSVGLKDRKKEIDEMLMSMIQERDEEKEKNKTPANGTVDGETELKEEALEEAVKPPAKKVKKETKTKSPKKEKHISKRLVASGSDTEENDNDAKVARTLQEEENGINLRKRKTKRTPRTTKKASTGEKSTTGFQKVMALSPDLAKIVGADQMRRSEVVKKMWQVIRERNLSDPKDKRFHICDDELLKVFGTKRVKTFSMMKYLKQHIIPGPDDT